MFLLEKWLWDIGVWEKSHDFCREFTPVSSLNLKLLWSQMHFNSILVWKKIILTWKQQSVALQCVAIRSRSLENVNLRLKACIFAQVIIIYNVDQLPSYHLCLKFLTQMLGKELVQGFYRVGAVLGGNLSNFVCFVFINFVPICIHAMEGHIFS